MASSSDELVAALATGRHVLAEPRNGVHIDALAYVDNQLDEPGMREKVNDMVRAEMSKFAKRDYLELLPPSVEPTFGGSAVLQAEYARVAAAQDAAAAGRQASSTTPAISTNHYNTAVLPEEDGDTVAWQAAVDKARVRVEAQSSQSVNLELLGKYGTAAWKGHAQQLEGVASQTQTALKRLEKSSDDVNAARRSAQAQKGVTLAGHAGDWSRAMDSSFQLKVAIAELQGKVDTMRAMAAAKGLHTPAGAPPAQGSDADGDVQLS